MIKHLLGIFLLCAFSCFAFAVDKPLTDIQVSAEIPWTNKESYTPVILFIESTNDDEISFEINYRNITSAERTVAVKKGFKHSYTILLPSATYDIGLVDIKWQSKSGKSGSLRSSPYHETRDFYLGIIGRDSTLLGQDFLDNIRSFTGSSGYSDDKHEDIKPQSIPEYWQGIPLWSAFLLTPKGDKKIQKAQRSALKQWVRAGGTLYVTTPKLAADWQLSGIDTTVLNDKTNNKAFHKRLEHLAIQDNGGIRQYRVPGTDQVPTGAFITIMIIFVILVGPANYIWVRRKQQLHLFLITTPIISLIFSVFMGAYGLLADGLSAYRSTIELTYIDHKHKQSCTWTSISWFSGLSPGSINVSQNSSIQLANDKIYDSYYRNREQKTFHTAWGQQQTADGDWLLSRKHQQIQISTPRPEERRLIVRKSGNSYTIQNGFDVDIEKVTWYDDNKKAWSATDLAAGTTKTLIQKNLNYSLELTQLKRFTVDAQHKFNLKTTPYFFRASLSKPIHDVPGPSANDAEEPSALLCGKLEVQP